jgi:hypothetical protein
MGAAERRCRGCRDRAGRHLLPGGEVVDDDDVVVLCRGICKVRTDEAGPAGDDVAHEESMMRSGLGLSEFAWRGDRKSSPNHRGANQGAKGGAKG